MCGLGWGWGSGREVDGGYNDALVHKVKGFGMDGLESEESLLELRCLTNGAWHDGLWRLLLICYPARPVRRRERQ